MQMRAKSIHRNQDENWRRVFGRQRNQSRECAVRKTPAAEALNLKLSGHEMHKIEEADAFNFNIWGMQLHEEADALNFDFWGMECIIFRKLKGSI